MAHPVELPYDESTRCAERHAWFASVRPLGWAAFLDSGDPSRTTGRYDVIAAGPIARIMSDDPGSAGAFDAVRRMLAGARGDASPWPDSGRGDRLLRLRAGAPRGGPSARKPGAEPFMPEAAIGLYAWTVVVDHVERRAAITSLDSFHDRRRRASCASSCSTRRRAARAVPRAGRDRLVAGARGVPAARARIIDYIEAGDCYQANLTREFRAGCSGDPWDLYRHLHDTNPAPMGAFLEYPFGAVLSSSPERFVTVEGREVAHAPDQGHAAGGAPIPRRTPRPGPSSSPPRRTAPRT